MIFYQYINGVYFTKLMEDFQGCLDPLSFEDRVKFTKALINYTKLKLKYYEDKGQEVPEEISDFFTKHFLEPFGEKITHAVHEYNFFSYFDPVMIFVNKDLISLEYFNHVMYPQGFTDEEFKIVLKRYLDIFETRLEFLYLKSKPNSSPLKPNILSGSPLQDFRYKIHWLGTPEQLAELFIELFRKGFIPEIPEAKVIQQLFENSLGIEQYLPPAVKFNTKEDAYQHIFSDSYRPRFDSIRPTYVTQKHDVKELTHKIYWIGVQKGLAELFIELFRKGYIPEIPKAKVIKQLFDNTKSMSQYLKPGTNTKTDEDTYEKLYSGYSPCFDSIRHITN